MKLIFSVFPFLAKMISPGVTLSLAWVVSFVFSSLSASKNWQRFTKIYIENFLAVLLSSHRPQIVKVANCVKRSLYRAQCSYKYKQLKKSRTRRRFYMQTTLWHTLMHQQIEINSIPKHYSVDLNEWKQKKPFKNRPNLNSRIKTPHTVLNSLSRSYLHSNFHLIPLFYGWNHLVFYLINKSVLYA